MKIIDFVSDWTGKLVCWLIVPQIFALVYEVVVRYFFNSPTIWSYDITYMVYATHYLMGAGYTLRTKRHIKVEVFSNYLPPLWQATVHLICYLIFFAPFIIALTYGGIGFTHTAWEIKEKSIYSSWRPILFPFKGMMAVSFVLLFLQGISEFVRLVTCIRVKV